MLVIIGIQSTNNMLKWLVGVLLLDQVDYGNVAVCVGCVRVARNTNGVASIRGYYQCLSF